MDKTYPYDFETRHDRRNTHAVKWTFRPDGHGQFAPLEADSIPMWVADMDIPVAPEIINALHHRIDHPFFGYTMPYEELRDVVVDRMAELYGWHIERDWILFNPGMVVTLNLVAQVVGQAGDGILMNSPIYGPFQSTARHRRRYTQMVEMQRVDDDERVFHYEIDFDQLEANISPQTSLYFLCNPHNPGGRAYTREELEKIAELCIRHDITICSDEIHADLVLGDHEHIPIAALSPEIAERTITLMAPTKTFNLAGMACSLAIVPNDDLRARLQECAWSSGYHVDTLAYEAALAGYRDGGAWLSALRQYLTDNRDLTVNFMREYLAPLRFVIPEATYLMWIDTRQLALPEQYDSAQVFFAREAKVVFNQGQFFGPSGAGFVRLNFAMPRSSLEEGLSRMKAALDQLK